MNRRISVVLAAVTAVAGLFPLTVVTAEADDGVVWPAGQAFPHFQAPAGELYGFDMRSADLDDCEKVMLSTLQGIVNRKQPRLFLFDHVSEGKYKWPDLLGLSIDENTSEGWIAAVAEYSDELRGVILYDPSKSRHYANLASTVASLEDCIPVTPQIYAALEAAGVSLPVVEDFTALAYTKPQEIYEFMYEKYWERCTDRLLVSLPPDKAYIRDLASACGAAVVWLDARNWPENTVLRRFLGSMTPGKSIVTGWYAEERSGIGLATEYGLSTVPSDFYENSTVYAGMPHDINMPEVPRMPELENKIYLAVFLSDGDNVQYCQHAMSSLWDHEGRGSIPINWTVSPALADLGPAILNYYYSTATPNDFFASGPSGMGYSLIYDSHNYVWNSTSGSGFVPYARLTQKYLQKSGLRVITVWDEVSREQMDVYARECRYLYGVTQQDWERRPYKVPAYISGSRLSFIPNLPCYASGVDVIYSFWKDAVAGFDGSAPLFLSAQGESWKMGPDNIAALKEQLEALSPGNIVICRGDHFFNLFNEANGLPFNLTLSPGMKIRTSRSSSDTGDVADGSCSAANMWTGEGDGAWVEFDFGDEYLIDRYVFRHASSAGLPSWMNVDTFTVKVSRDGRKWQNADHVVNPDSDAVDTDIRPVIGRYVRIEVDKAGKDGKSRIADIEIYGRLIL